MRDGFFTVGANSFQIPSASKRQAVRLIRMAMGDHGPLLSLRSTLRQYGLTPVEDVGGNVHEVMGDHVDIDLAMMALDAVAPCVEPSSYIRLLSEESDSDWAGVCVRFDTGSPVIHDMHLAKVEWSARDSVMELLADALRAAAKLGVGPGDLHRVVDEAGVASVMEG
jgi:hypothetical protein